MITSDQQQSFREKSFKIQVMLNILRLMVLLHHISQISGHILFGRCLTAWKSYICCIALFHSLHTATWTRITWLLKWFKRKSVSLEIKFNPPPNNLQMFISSRPTWILIYLILMRSFGQAYMVSVLPVYLLAPSTFLCSSAGCNSKTKKNLQGCNLTMAGWKKFSTACCLSQQTVPRTKELQMNAASLRISTFWQK